jgi:hypothetical protein
MSFILHLGLRTAHCRFFCGKCTMADKVSLVLQVEYTLVCVKSVLANKF